MKNQYKKFDYPDRALQKNYSKYITHSQFDKIRNNGKASKPFENSLYIQGSWKNSEKELLNCNDKGIYEYYLTKDELGEFRDKEVTLTINDENGNIVYASADSSKTLTPFLPWDYTYMRFIKEQVFLSNSSNEQLKLSMNGWEKVLIRIDTRAGVENPLISMFAV